MDDDDTWWWALDLEMRQQEEECEHGIHRDSGHVCMECLVNGGNEDAPIG